jgi:hypothetical protein
VREDKGNRTADRFFSVRDHAFDRYLSLLQMVLHFAEQGGQIALRPAEERASQQENS